jgi:hypothetical protein
VECAARLTRDADEFDAKLGNEFAAMIPFGDFTSFHIPGGFWMKWILTLTIRMITGGTCETANAQTTYIHHINDNTTTKKTHTKNVKIN